uniref:Proteasome activator complex subunit 4 C-terminal domain-containing protein n=1 Tax=Trichuris muris TaxID=70415 RepID=A0A5S6QTL5_TRIMR
MHVVDTSAVNNVNKGKRWQREEHGLKYLPYYVEASSEADQWLSDIKAGIGQSLLKCEIPDALVYWFKQLRNYVSIYGMRFTKQDHINFIRIIFALVTSPDFDIGMVTLLCQLMMRLLKNVKLISRDDLQVDWKPLYRLEKRIVRKDDDATAVIVPSILPELLKKITKDLSSYFPEESTREILHFFLPKFCPWSVSATYPFSTMATLLPTKLPPSAMKNGFRLWIEEIIDLWKTYHGSNSWEGDLINLLARVAYDNVGYIDWDRHMDFIFTKILRSFKLVVLDSRDSTKTRLSSTLQSCVLDEFPMWVAAMIGGKSKALQSLEILLKAVHPYCHPSNNGAWQVAIFGFLHRLSYMVCKRVKFERRKTKCWFNWVPEKTKIAEKDITAYVNISLPCVISGVFSKCKSHHVAACLHYLASLKAEAVIPHIFKCCDTSILSIDEPHRLTESLICFEYVATSLLRSPDFITYGLQLIPMLKAILPQMNMYDVDKLCAILNTLCTYFTMIPLVDSSSAQWEMDNLTQQEKELCSMTAILEDIIGETFDRIFLIVQNFGVHANEYRPERLSDSSISSIINSEEDIVVEKIKRLSSCILFNCETSVYEVLVNRILHFVEENVFENEFGHDIICCICAAACKSNPENSFEKFFHLLRSRLHRGIDEHTKIAEEVEIHVLRDIEMLSAVLNVSGSVLAKFCDEIVEVLQLIGSLGSRNAGPVFSNCLSSVLEPLCSISLVERLFNFELLNLSPNSFLPIRNWASSVDSGVVPIKWTIPGPSELAMAETVLKTFLMPALDSLENPEKLSKNRLLSTLQVVDGLCKGLFSVLPPIEGDIIPPGYRISNTATYTGPIVHPDKSHVLRLSRNTKNSIRKVLSGLIDYMIECREDETTSMKVIIEIYSELIVPFATLETFCVPWQRKNKSDLAFHDESVDSAGQPAAWLMKKVVALHQRRLERIYTSGKVTTEHLAAAKDLLKLALSQYPKTRASALSVLGDVFQAYNDLGKMVVDDVLEFLKQNETVNPEQFEAAVNVLCINRGTTFLCKRDWSMVSKAWPALVRSRVSDKVSITDTLAEAMVIGLKTFSSFAVEYQIPNEVATLGKNLWVIADRGAVVPSQAIPQQYEIDISLDRLKEENRNNLIASKALAHQMIEAGKEKTTPSVHLQLAWRLLFVIMQHDKGLPADGVKVFVNLLTDCRYSVRETAIHAITCQLMCRARKTDKVNFQYPVEPLQNNSSEHCHIRYSVRQDNVVCLYNRDKLPSGVEEWNTTQFIPKTATGLNLWPEKLLVQAPLKMQPYSDRLQTELEEEEANIYAALSDESFLKEFVDVLTTENKADHEVEKLSPRENFFFQAVFRTFGFPIWKAFKNTVERLVKSKRPEKHRLAAEIVSGLISGMKLWSYEMQQECQLWIISVLKTAVNNMPVNVIGCWAAAFGVGVSDDDPRRCHLLIDYLSEYFKCPVGTANERLCQYVIANCVFEQYSWRLLLVYSELMKYLQNQLAEEYGELRECVGRLVHLMLCFSSIRNETALEFPNQAAFIEQCLQRIKILEVETSLEYPGANDTASSISGGDVLARETQEREESLKILKTLLSFLKLCCINMGKAICPESAKILPFLFYFDNETSDAPLKHMCRQTLRGYLPQCFLTQATVPHVIDQCEMTAQRKWWKARVSVLQFLQMCIFSNLFCFSNDTHKNRVSKLVMCLLQDQQVEVRKAASKCFCTFFRCGYMKPHDKSYLGTWIEWSKSKDTVVRHGGVLGLAAIVDSNPYSVPNYLPDVLMALCNQTGDSAQLISSTAKSTLLEFKRTHVDSWKEHVQNFTDDQLALLTDILISPSYYV